jgi:peroxiredoxin Q/BCP
MNTLKIGQKAPNFKGLDQHGNWVELKQFKGQKLILYFYPKDDTPTCTVESCNLQENQLLLNKKGYTVVGVSADSVKSHLKFANKFNLTFPLIADESMKIINDYGVWGEKMLFGREYMGIIRTTYVIDEKGKIEQIIEKVDSKNHAEQILEG